MYRRLQTVVVFLLALSVAGCGGGGQSSLGAQSALPVIPSAATALRTASAVTTGLAAASTAYTAINAGSSSAIGQFSADADYNGGLIASVTTAINTAATVNAAPQSVYQTQRYGSVLTYKIPKLTPNGAYTVRLHFAEAFFHAAQQRVFSVTINGAAALTNFDMFQAAGGSNIAIVKSFSSTADAAGTITVRFAASVNNASVAGIEAVATPAAVSSSPLPGIQINAGGPASGSWLADTDYNSASNTWIVSNAVATGSLASPAPQAVLQTQRYAQNLVYAIPNLTPGAPYNVRLHFAESYFTSAGQRIFNVAINGTQVLTNLDIFAAAGGENIALIKSFSSTADSTGKLTIAMTATVNNASIAGLEILPSAPVPASSSPTPSPAPVTPSSPTPSPAPATSPTPAPKTSPTPAPVAPVTSQTKTMHGIVTNSLGTWDTWHGKSPQFVGLYNDNQASTWSAINDIDWLLTIYPTGTPMVWSMATYPTSSSLAAVSTGSANSYYATWAAEILASAPAPDGNYYIRPNWEVPGNWFSWGGQAAASPSNFIASFQQIAKVFHAASSKFKMVWDTFPVYGDVQDHAIYYPGDSYVDIVSQDVYPDTTNGNSAANAWNYDLITPNGLNWLSTFATQHGKRIAISEWGVNTDTAGPIVTDFANWFKANNVLYDVYFDEGQEQLSNNQFPTAGAVYQANF